LICQPKVFFFLLVEDSCLEQLLAMKVMKIAAVILGLFVASLAFLAHKGWIDIKWTAMESGIRLALANVSTQ
jgi:uncharacterized membrane protein (Fun14 family)